MSDALQRLAVAHGIAPHYHDIWGIEHRVSDASLVALLAAMGTDAGDAAGIDAALRVAEADDASRAIAPLLVLFDDERPWTLRFRVADVHRQAQLAAEVTGEEGLAIAADATARARVDAEATAGGGSARIEVDVVLDAALAPGYYTVALHSGAQRIAHTTCAIAPRRCYLPAPHDQPSAWGPAVQLYGVRSSRNWGIGDLGDVRTIAEQWGERGAGVLGLSPMHALFAEQPWRASPYSPSSRLFRNTLHIDVESVREFRECEEARERVASAPFKARLAALRAAALVDYAGVAAAKHEVLDLVYRCFRERHLARDDARAAAFRAFVAEGGAALHQHALFEALQEHFHRGDAAAWGWPAWPAAYRSPASPDVARFAAENETRIGYFMYVQWQAELQFESAAEGARAAGMPIGLYTDLAVSVDPGGAESWARQGLYARGASVGAPPDAFNMHGQDWGLPPVVPTRLVADAYAPFLATLRANMRHAGALRIDHVMGLARLFWVPAGAAPAEGAYVHYPFDALLGLLALESHRHRCIVIGEDLGTVPDAIREALMRHGVLSYRVLIFERDAGGEFIAPRDYPEQALVTASTHDLPTLAGWWAGTDIALRASQGLLNSAADAEAQAHDRATDRARLAEALQRAGEAIDDIPEQAGPAAITLPVPSAAVQRYLAATRCRLQMVQLEDVLGVVEQANLPGTTDSHPNWRRKLPLALEQWPGSARFDVLVEDLARLRPRQRALLPGLEVAIVPRSTYRLQLNHAFTFADATALVPYLAALGVSHVYCSPYLRARPGSLHGYDIVDHRAINPEIGSRADFERFVAVLEAHRMGHICDVVPNHVGVMGSDNRWWMDVLESGPASIYAEYFDIDWAPADAALAGRIVVPVLGDPYGSVLERGDLKLVFEAAEGVFAVHYFEHRFPLDLRTCDALVDAALTRCRAALAPDAQAALGALIDALRALPPRSAEGDARARRQRDVPRCKATLALLAARHGAFAGALADVVHASNGTPDDASSFDDLHALIETQAFRLAYWRVAADEINYRRFFDINDLAALRMENDAVFDATHRLVLELAAAGKIHGLRIDHPDGLRDPAAYLERLQQRYRAFAAARRGQEPASIPPLYVVLEKIAASHERMPADWPVSGSTGYRFANLVNGLFVDTSAKARIDRAWRAFVGAEAGEYDSIVVRSKFAIMRGALAAELTMISNRALRIARDDRNTRDFTLNLLREAIEEIVAHFPVYRTYVDIHGASPQDVRYIDWAVARARRASRSADTSVFDFLRTLMLGHAPAEIGEARQVGIRAFAARFQQFTSPVAAKGVEDTAFYRFNRLVSLNDVGGSPDEFGTSVRAFHRATQSRAAAWPTTLLATSTHDNKRSGDVRARIDVISEDPPGWRLTMRRWSRMNRSRKRSIEGRDAPSRSDEYLLYQTLVGTFPAEPADAAALALYAERIVVYMTKAAREAKTRTSWFVIDGEYEDALAAFVRSLLGSSEPNLFVDDLRRRVTHFAWFGRLNSVSMALVKFASPGVPDIYQGTELVDLRLVDPDNRTAVDYALRHTALDAMRELDTAQPHARHAALASWFASPDDGRAKLWVTRQLLQLRSRGDTPLVAGDYLPLDVHGERAHHVVAFARRHGDEVVIAVAGRLFASMGLDAGVLPLGAAAWGDTAVDVAFLPADTSLINVLDGEPIDIVGGRLPMARLFGVFPGAVLRRREGSPAEAGTSGAGARSPLRGSRMSGTDARNSTP